jgi:threonine dehydratase
MYTLTDLENAAELVHGVMQPSPQIQWPLLCGRAGTDVWVKHENHNPTGSFKIRGGITYTADLRRERPDITGVVAATRGNFGQSVAHAAAKSGLSATIVVPFGNSVEKNAAMRAYGAELVEHGHDFQAALEFAETLSVDQGLHFVPSFDWRLVKGVASYGLELLRAVPDLDSVYVPIGLGSGICGVIEARDALGLKTRIVGVVAERAPTYALSFENRRPIPTNSADTMADGVACRVPVAEVVDIIVDRIERVVRVEEEEMMAAMRHYFTDTHNVAEGAGAAPLAALLKERESVRGQKVGLVLSGGNIDRDRYAAVLTDG